MPNRTYISEEERSAPGFKAAKDRVTILLGGNAHGDFKFKPLFIARAANPRALRGYVKSNLPVIYKDNKKAWITGSMFHHWFSVYAVPAMKEYCHRENMDFKILMIIDNAPAHPSSLSDINENVMIVFLPPNTTSLLQPMDQTVNAAFKAYYLRRTFTQLLNATDGPDKPSIREFWKSFNILDAIKNVAKAWEDVTESCMNGAWSKLWPGCVHHLTAAKDVVPIVNKETLGIARQVGFEELEPEDIDEVLASHGDELSNEDLQQLEAENVIHDDGSDDEPTPKKDFRAKELGIALHWIQKGLDLLTEMDPNFERSSKIARNVQNELGFYHETHRTMKKSAKQTTLMSFFAPQEKIPSQVENEI